MGTAQPSPATPARRLRSLSGRLKSVLPRPSRRILILSFIASLVPVVLLFVLAFVHATACQGKTGTEYGECVWRISAELVRKGESRWPRVLIPRCEDQFIVIPFVAEFFSTFTTLLFIFLGVRQLLSSGYSDEVVDLAVAVFLLNGISAFMSHGTQWRFWGQMDSITINVMGLLFLYSVALAYIPSLNRRPRWRTAILTSFCFLMVLTMVWNGNSVPNPGYWWWPPLVIVFIVLFLIIFFMRLTYSAGQWHHGRTKRMLLLGCIFFFLAVMMWVIEEAILSRQCSAGHPLPISLHPFWHIFIAIGMNHWVCVVKFFRGKFFGFDVVLLGWEWGGWPIFPRVVWYPKSYRMSYRLVVGTFAKLSDKGQKSLSDDFPDDPKWKYLVITAVHAQHEEYHNGDAKKYGHASPNLTKQVTNGLAIPFIKLQPSQGATKKATDPATVLLFVTKEDAQAVADFHYHKEEAQELEERKQKTPRDRTSHANSTHETEDREKRNRFDREEQDRIERANEQRQREDEQKQRENAKDAAMRRTSGGVLQHREMEDLQRHLDLRELTDQMRKITLRPGADDDDEKRKEEKGHLGSFLGRLALAAKLSPRVRRTSGAQDVGEKKKEENSPSRNRSGSLRRVAKAVRFGDRVSPHQRPASGQQSPAAALRVATESATIAPAQGASRLTSGQTEVERFSEDPPEDHAEESMAVEDLQ